MSEKCRLLWSGIFLVVAGVIGFFEVFRWIFLIFRKAGKNLLDFGVDLIDIFHPRIKIFLGVILTLSIIGILGRCDATSWIDRILHIVVIVDNRLLHLSDLTEDDLLLFSVAALKGGIIVLLVIRPAVVSISHT